MKIWCVSSKPMASVHVPARDVLVRTLSLSPDSDLASRDRCDGRARVPVSRQEDNSTSMVAVSGVVLVGTRPTFADRKRLKD